MQAYIRSYSFVSAQTLISPTETHIRSNPALASLRCEEVCDSKLIHFGQLALPDKLAFSAASLALRAASPQDPDNTGIVLCSSAGSIVRDHEYMRSVVEGFPRPALFTATLPSSPIAEIAIFFQLKGSNRVILSPDNAPFLALQTAMLMLEEVPEILFISVDTPQDTPINDDNSSATALLLSKEDASSPQISLISRGIPQKKHFPLRDLIASLGDKTDFIDDGIEIRISKQ